VNVIGCIKTTRTNAFFDATGKRMREYPLTPARVLAALKQG
jgi:CO/xanthine dehydrogenase Mo-binding subunit